MVRQTKVNTNGKENIRSENARSSSPFHVARDAIKLGEFQFQLLASDLRSATHLVRQGSLALIAAICLFFATAPIYLLSLASFLESQFELTTAGSLLITAIAASFLILILYILGRSLMKHGAGKLERSREELLHNLHWVKQTLSSTDRN